MSKNPETINSKAIATETFNEEELSFQIKSLALDRKPRLFTNDNSRISGRKRALSEMSENSELATIFDSRKSEIFQAIAEESLFEQADEGIVTEPQRYKRQRSFSEEQFGDFSKQFEPRKRSFSEDELNKRAQQNNNRNGQNSR